jgi:hypothetical protein
VIKAGYLPGIGAVLDGSKPGVRIDPEGEVVSGIIRDKLYRGSEGKN